VNDADRLRCERLAFESKTGKPVSAEDFKFLERMWREYPDEYKAIGQEARDKATAAINPLFSSDMSE
jgi:hypothetical protein